MKKILKLLFITVSLTFTQCEDKDKILPEYYILNSDLISGRYPTGFSFVEMDIISFPNSKNIIPDFMIAVHLNERGDIVGPMLLLPELMTSLILIRSFDDLNSAQNCFDTLKFESKIHYFDSGIDVKPYEIWQIKTTSGEIGNILLLETKANIEENTPYAEIKFKARKYNP